MQTVLTDGWDFEGCEGTGCRREQLYDQVCDEECDNELCHWDNWRCFSTDEFRLYDRAGHGWDRSLSLSLSLSLVRMTFCVASGPGTCQHATRKAAPRRCSSTRTATRRAIQKSATSTTSCAHKNLRTNLLKWLRWAVNRKPPGGATDGEGLIVESFELILWHAHLF